MKSIRKKYEERRCSLLGKLFKNKTIRIFFLWYICLFLVAGSVVTATYLKEIKQEQKSYMLYLEEEVQNTINYFRQSFVAGVNTCNSIFSSLWYKHYRNVANIYSDEFNGMRKIEVMNDIAAKVTALPFVSDILIITPPPLSNVICKNGWFTFNDYDKIYGMVKIENSNTFTDSPTIKPASDSICVITLQDTTPRYTQGIICILIDKKMFASTLQRILSDSSVYVRADLCGQTLYESGTLTDELVVNTASINMPKFSITLASLRYEDSLMKARTMNYILVMLIVLLAGAILSSFITMIVLKPLSQIIKRFGGNFRQLDDPYYFITEYVETFSKLNKQLCIENENLNKSMNRFISLMRNEILFGMLTDPNYNFHDEYTSTSIPWINYGYPYILVLLEPKFQGEIELPTSSSFNLLSSSALHSCTFSILYNDLCILFWFKDMDLAKKQHSQIMAQLVQLSDGKYFFSISDVLQDPKSMGESYLMQKSKIADLRHAQFDLPLSIQIKLVNKLQQSKQHECLEILNELRLTNNPDAVMQLLGRIASKYSIDSVQTINQYYRCKKNNREKDQWEILISFTNELCKLINNVKQESINESAEIICRYIDENYSDPNLGVKQLADHFSMHRTLISKILKEHLGITFSDYLLDLRIKKSMELLKNTDMNITDIGKSVGYNHYVTFKRAFIRYYGVSPREFRIQFVEA